MKNIRSNFVKESLLDYENLANSLKENTSNAVKDLLSETVRETYNKILTEENDEDEDDYEIEEVEDTESENDDESNDAESLDNSDESEDTNESESEDEESESEDEESEDNDFDDNAEENNDTDNDLDQESELDVDITTDNSDGDEWAEFDKYKVSDDEYDFSNAEDDEIVKVYKLLKDDDQVLVNVDKEDNKVNIKDNEAGTEYLLDLGSLDNEDNDFDDISVDLNVNDNDMNESKIFEIALNEFDSNVGYTDNYQKSDVMSNSGMSEPGKNVNSWDAGIPKGTEKPWGKNKNFNEEENIDDIPMEEGTNVGGFVQQNSVSKSHIPNSNGRKARNSSVAGVKTKGTSTPRYSEATNESRKMLNKLNNILNENNKLKYMLNNFKNVLKEAAVTNLNLGQIIKLISENSTTKAEKEEIIKRFSNEAKTIEQSKSLYESISRELKRNQSNLKINEEKQFTINDSRKINETPIYKSKDLLESLDLMHRLCK